MPISLRTQVGNRASPTLFFQQYGINPTIDTEEEARSSFFAAVDSTSYELARSYLERGALPEPQTVRVEEIINRLDYRYPVAPEPVHVEAEAFPSPSRAGFHVLRLGLRAMDVSPKERKPASLVFVIDVSGSMETENRLGLVKRALRQLVARLESKDELGIVTYGVEARVKLPLTSSASLDRILAVIDALEPEGSTNVQAGILVGYQVARAGHRTDALNRIVLCSDGVGDNGVTTIDPIFDRVGKEASLGIALSVVGFGMGNVKDPLMEKLAERGQGVFASAEREEQARGAFVENLTGTSQRVARNLSVQLELDPTSVARYRLLGYENRPPRQQTAPLEGKESSDFDAGQSVTALYELELKKGSRDLGILRVRFQDPSSVTAKIVETPILRSVVAASFERAAPSSQLAFVAAVFAEKLRGAYWVRTFSYAALRALWSGLPADWKLHSDVVELKALIDKAAALDKRSEPFVRLQPVD